MKVTKVSTIFCDAGWRAFVYVKVETDEGLVGYAECADTRTPFGIAGAVHDLESTVIGKNPLAVERTYAEMMAAFQQNPDGIGRKAISAIEVALWDIKAKYHNVPLYELFGGPLRDSIRVYWSHFGTYRSRTPEFFKNSPPLKTMDDYYNLAKEAVAKGYTAFKTNILIPGAAPRRVRGFDQNIDYATLKGIEDLISTFRRATGENFDIMIDLNFNFKTDGYIQVARILEPYHPMWVELDIYDPTALLRIHQASKSPICSNECLGGMKGFAPYLENHSVDYCMIDQLENGYIESRRIAAMADMYETMVAPHNYYSHFATFQNAQWAACLPNLKIMETDYDSAPWRDDIITVLPDIKNGMLALPKKPGIGAELNEKEIAKHPWPK